MQFVANFFCEIQGHSEEAVLVNFCLDIGATMSLPARKLGSNV